MGSQVYLGIPVSVDYRATAAFADFRVTLGLVVWEPLVTRDTLETPRNSLDIVGTVAKAVTLGSVGNRATQVFAD